MVKNIDTSFLLETGKRPNKEIAIHTIRGWDVVGDHKVIFAGNGERIEIGHKTVSRKVFASGVLKACLFMAGVREDGLWFDGVIWTWWKYLLVRIINCLFFLR